MHFVAPLFLAGLLAVGIPLAIHLVGRRRAKTVRFSALDFLLASQKKVARRLRLRQLLLLAARVGVIAAVPLALAKPFAQGAADVPRAATRAQSAVLVIDDSASMSYRKGRTSLFEEARSRAKEIVSLLGPDSDVALVLGSEGAAAPVSELTPDRARLGRALSDLAPSLKGADLPLAIRRAAQILGTAGHAERRVFVLTDGAAHAWGADGLPGPGGSPEVVVVDCAGEQAPANHAIVGAQVAPAPQLGSRGVRLTAEVANFSDQPERAVPVTLRVGGKPIARGLLDLPARGRAGKAFYHVFPEGGYYDVVLELPEDGLSTDDRRYLRVEVRKEIRVLVVDGDPRTIRRDDELFYLETALRAGEGKETQLQVQTVSGDALLKSLSDFDVVFLCNVKAPLADRVALLRRFVEQGGGLFLSVGDNVDPDAYQHAFGDLLPQPLQGARVVTAEKRTEGEGRLENEGPAERLGRIDRHHPLLAVFPPTPTGLLGARFYRLMLLAPTPESEKSHTLLRFESGAPALVEAEIGAGHVLLYTSTVDRDWTDLPIRPDFLPLMQQAARYLARAPMREPEPPGLIGRVHQVPITPEDNRVEISAPSGARKLYERADLSGHREIAFSQTSEPGFYRVSVATGDAQRRPRPDLGFAINGDPKESDFGKVGRAGAPGAGEAKGPGASVAAGTVPRRIELWHAVAAALLLFMLGEAALVRRG